MAGNVHALAITFAMHAQQRPRKPVFATRRQPDKLLLSNFIHELRVCLLTPAFAANVASEEKAPAKFVLNITYPRA